MKTGYATLAIVGVAAAIAVYALSAFSPKEVHLNSTSNDLEFVKFVAKYGKSYGTVEEFQYRKNLFTSNLETISQLNSANAEFTLAANKFADYTEAELKNLLGYKPMTGKAFKTFKATGASVPNGIDWREKGVVNAVKDQGSCGSCWAFSAIGSIESHHAIKTGELISLSEQQLVDCSTAYGNEGCNGGWMSSAFDYALEHGINTEAAYPYAGVDQTCQNEDGAVKVESYTNVTANDQDALVEALSHGPVSVAVSAGNIYFYFYSKGILTQCGNADLDHGVVAVGYGDNYYIVRNSWGASWGEQGYIRIGFDKTKNSRGLCGIQEVPNWPETN